MLLRTITITVMGTRMNTSALLTLTQWLSPGFPISAYAYSHGLEHAIDSGALTDADGLRDWLEDVLAHGSGRSDAILLCAAYRAPPETLQEIDDIARAYAASAGRLMEAVDQGAAFTRTVDDIWGTEIGRLCYPVAVGHAARLKMLPLVDTLGIYTHAFAAALISATVRLIPLGQTEGQAVLASLAPVVEETCNAAMDSDLSDLASSCFALDIASMQHETQYSKVFRT